MKFVIIIALFLMVYNISAQTPSYSSSGVPYIEGNRFTKVTSLTPNTSNDNCIVLSMDTDSSDGYSVQVETTYGGSYSLAHSWWFPEPGAWSVVGLAPVYGKYILFMGKSFSKDPVKDFKRRQIPLKKLEISKWIKGDAVFWNSEGGAILGVGAGISPVHLGANITVKGSWAHYVEKTGDNKVFVSLINRNIKSLTLSAGVLYAGLSEDFIRAKAKTKSYEVELVDEDHEFAYRMFLKGNDSFLLKLIEEGSNSIEAIETTSYNTNSINNNLGVATPYIPIISWSSSRNRIEEVLEGSTSWDTDRSRHSSKYERTRNFRFFHLNSYRLNQLDFFHEVKEENDYENNTRKRSEEYFLELNYLYEASFGKFGKLKRQFEKMNKVVGFGDRCIDGSNINRKLGYTILQNKLKFTSRVAKFISQLIKEKSFSTFLIKFTDSFYSKKLKLDIERINKIEQKDDHLRILVAKIGKIITRNPELYQLMYKLGQKCGMQSSFEVGGQYITKYIKSDLYEYSSNCPFEI